VLAAATAVIKSGPRIPPRSATKMLSDFGQVSKDHAVLSAVNWGMSNILGDPLLYDRKSQNDIIIHSDSKYAIEQLKKLKSSWQDKNWKTAAARKIKNSDILREASILQKELEKHASVKYEQISKEENGEANYVLNRYLSDAEAKEEEEEELEEQYQRELEDLNDLEE
jgi:ribonuclease HI